MNHKQRERKEKSLSCTKQKEHRKQKLIRNWMSVQFHLTWSCFTIFKMANACVSMHSILLLLLFEFNRDFEYIQCSIARLNWSLLVGINPSIRAYQLIFCWKYWILGHSFFPTKLFPRSNSNTTNIEAFYLFIHFFSFPILFESLDMDFTTIYSLFPYVKRKRRQLIGIQTIDGFRISSYYKELQLIVECIPTCRKFVWNHKFMQSDSCNGA